jgi:hypothetical protein
MPTTTLTMLVTWRSREIAATSSVATWEVPCCATSVLLLQLGRGARAGTGDPDPHRLDRGSAAGCLSISGNRRCGAYRQSPRHRALERLPGAVDAIIDSQLTTIGATAGSAALTSTDLLRNELRWNDSRTTVEHYPTGPIIVVGGTGYPAPRRGVRAGNIASRLHFVEQYSPGWVELLQQVEIGDVARQDRVAVLASRRKDQRIIHEAVAVGPGDPLESCQGGGEDPGVSPDLSVRRDRAVDWPPIEKVRDPPDRIVRSRVRRVEQRTNGRELGLGHGRMPSVGSPQDDVGPGRCRKPASKDV